MKTSSAAVWQEYLNSHPVLDRRLQMLASGGQTEAFTAALVAEIEILFPEVEQ